MRQRRYSSYELSSGCGAEACLEVIGGKWKGVILHHLITCGVLRFSEIQRLKPSLSPRVLTAQLRELEQDERETQCEPQIDRRQQPATGKDALFDQVLSKIIGLAAGFFGRAHG